ncbi:MAG: aspartate aminotransferase family protein [Chloroflexi bacterium]|nr:aspartate aminotransferase family protein [Chloroflexota bacterium]
MKFLDQTLNLRYREAPLDMRGASFRTLGYGVIDKIADLFDELPQRPVTTGESPQAIRQLLGPGGLPERGTPATHLLEEATELLFDHSLFNGHPRFWGYITASAAPIGVLADLLAAAVNPNVGAFMLSPMATEIEAQTIRWIADLIGYPSSCGGLLVSGGNMANFVGFLAARKARASEQADGSSVGIRPATVYVSQETHTWIDKAAELSGLGADAVRWITVNAHQQMDPVALEKQIIADRAAGCLPFLVVGTAGTTSTGATDPLPEMAAICRKYALWFHVDGAYGAPAAVLPDASPDLLGLREADSIALDPHKWLYSPLEAGCVLVRDPRHLVETFSHHPTYYNFNGGMEDSPINYHEFGLQNSRGFRALKVWLALRQVGRAGYREMIGDDIALAQALYAAINTYPELQAVTQNLSITTFRFVPLDLPHDPPAVAVYLNKLNEALLNCLQKSGEAFVSNAVVEGNYLLRSCIVNFRTTLKDVEALPEIVIKLGRQLDTEMRSQFFSIQNVLEAV